MVVMMHGFSVLPYGSPALGVFTVPGTTIRLSLRREIAPLALAFCRDFNNTVEKLHPGWCWGHSPKRIEGTTRWSEHAWGGAWDLNAPAHPMGRANTFSLGERDVIGDLLDRYRYQGVRLIRWGGNYTGRKDDMHFEVIADRSVVLAAVKVLQRPAPAKPAKPEKGGVHKQGSRRLQLQSPALQGADVGYVQRWIGTTHCGPADGVFAGRTEAGVRWYQRGQGLLDDGIVGKVTWSHMRVKATF